MKQRSFPSSCVALVILSSAVAWAQPSLRPPSNESSPDAGAAAAFARLDPATRRGLSLQVTLDRAGFSPGVIDGRPGRNTARARDAWVAAGRAGRDKSASTAPVDEGTVATGVEPVPNGPPVPLTTYAITPDDAAGPFVELPDDMMEKAKLATLGYTSMIELLAERFHSSPGLLQRLNPGARFAAGESIVVPDVEPFVAHVAKPAGAKATQAAALTVTVTDRTKTLQVVDTSGAVVFHAPVTVGSKNDPLPVGEWKVNGVSVNPTFNYNPDLFWDADPAHAKARIPPGPNNPVGVVWIDLSKEHYGIHGTPEPSRIGYSESHGCIRLTNWDAMRLAALVVPGTKVILR